MADLIEAHWLSLPSQGNIYSMTKLVSSNKANKVLVASLERKIYSCEYHWCPMSYLRPLVKEQLFTYIPSGAEIISIDAYNKQDSGNELVIGVTLVKQSNESSVERYLNIYTEGVGDGDAEESSSIESIAQNCLMLELSYTPYHLFHTFLPSSENGNEIVWLISGDDQNIHMIREDKLSHGYTELPVGKYFPELADLRAVALKIDIHYYARSKRRLTAVGCKCGLVKVSLIDVDNLAVMKCWTLRYDSPISSVNIFPDGNRIPVPELWKQLAPANNDETDEDPFLNVLVVNALNGTVVFTDVLRCGMKSDVTLIGTESTDCVLSSCIADINMDGANEILLGTYDQELMIFARRDDVWRLTDTKQFDAPIYSIAYVDLTGDGVKELVVMTQQGVHIMQVKENSKIFIEDVREHKVLQIVQCKWQVQSKIGCRRHYVCTESSRRYDHFHGVTQRVYIHFTHSCSDRRLLMFIVRIIDYSVPNVAVNDEFIAREQIKTEKLDC